MDFGLSSGLGMRMEGITENSTLLCVPIMADSIDAMIINLKKAGEHGADIVEIRLDSLKVFNPHEDLKSLIMDSPVPTIFTYRPKWEGGQYDGDENQRREVLRLAMKLGADYIDVELQRFSGNMNNHISFLMMRDTSGNQMTSVPNPNDIGISVTGSGLGMETGNPSAIMGISTQKANSIFIKHFEVYCIIGTKVAHEFIDSIRQEKPENFKVVVSSHNYENTPSLEDLGSLVAEIQASGADIVKIVSTALDITDVSRVFQMLVYSQVPIIGLVMNDRGLIARVLCPKFGGYLTFGTLEKGIVSAPGQPTIKDLLNIYNFRLIGLDTKVFGVIGNPVDHSKLPLLYNELFKLVGFNGIYVPFLVDDPIKFLDTYSSSDIAGFSVTSPHKEAVFKYCDEVDPVGKATGAVNHVVRRQTDGKLCGYNTDCYGAISAIEDGLLNLHSDGSTVGSPLAGRLFVLIGAGGVGKSLAYGAKQKGARVVIANRTYDRARELADRVGGQAMSLADLENFHPEGGMILANTTSIGMQPKVDETPISKHALKHYSLVFDAVYTPKMTRLLREAEETGAAIVPGLEMLIRQAYQQYEGFTGLPAPKERIRKILANSE